MTGSTSAAGPVPATSGKLGLGAQIGYGVGQIAGQVFRDLPSLLLLFYMTTVLGISPAIAGTAIFVPKLIIGVCCDMAVGIYSDRWQHRIARRWWLLAGAAAAPAVMLLLFHVPDGSTAFKTAYLSGVFSLYMVAFAIFSVPYLAISGELTSDPQQRTVLMAWRLVFTAVGVLTAGALAPAIVQIQGGDQAAYQMMALVLAIICPLALLLAFFGVGRAMRQSNFKPTIAPRVTLTPREAIALLAAPRFSILLGVNLLQLVGTGMGYASMLYFLTYNMERTDAFQLIGGLVMIACAGIIVAQPLWVKISARFGKRPSYIAATLIYAVIYLIWAFSAKAGVPLAYALSFLAAIGNSGWAMLGFSMLSDIAGDDEHRAGLYSAAWVAADKIGIALGGTLLVGLILSAFGFDSGRAVAGLPQSGLALTGVMFAFGIIPAGLNIIGAIIFARFGKN